MPNFVYTAVDQSGKSIRGQMEAINDGDLELRLKRLGLDLVTLRIASKRNRLFRPGASLRDLIMFCFEMEQLIRAGVPILQALADLRDSAARPALREMLGQLIAAVEGGHMLSQAMAQHPQIFDRVFVSLVKTGEQSGKLADVFENLASALKWQDELLAQTRRVLAYPLFILAVVLGATVFLMTYLVPQMTGFLAAMGQDMPIYTQVMIALSDAIVHAWWAFASAPLLVLGVAVIAVRHSPQARYRYDELQLHLPVVGPILHKIILTRFARYFALMYRSGIPILEGIQNCREIVGNRVIADGLERAHQQITAGAGMSTGFGNLGLFPPLVIRMLRIGENTGALDAALLNVSYFYDRDVRNAVENLLKLLEPTLVVLLGGLLAFIMFSVLGPVYEALSSMKF